MVASELLTSEKRICRYASATAMSGEPRSLLMHALEANDVAAIEALVHDHPNLLNAPNGRPAVTAARNVATAERLLSMGADVGAVGKWWAPGFYTRKVVADVGRFLSRARRSSHCTCGGGPWVGRSSG